MCPRNIAHEPPKDARVNFGIHILTKTEVYSHFQQLRINIKVTQKCPPTFFFLGGPHKGGPYTHQNLNFCPTPPAGPLFVHTFKKNQKCPTFEWPT